MTEQDETPMHTPIQAEPLELTQTPDGPRIETAPLPEYIAVAPELWEQAEVYDPYVDADTGIAPPPIWLEHPPHAGSVDADGNWTEGTPDTILHIDAVNVACAYRLVAEQPDGTRLLQLGSWGEK
jgi:hypothetical protein